VTGGPTAGTPRRGPAGPLRPGGRPSLIAHDPRPAGDGDRADWLARRLYARHRGEPVRVLEALAATLVARLATDGDPGAPQRVALPADPHLAVCRRIARRALAGAPPPPEAAGATRYHHADVHPAWARGRMPCGTLGDFVFYP
jgi:spore germination cell wall hydrolase CwlJ-like protein